MGFKDQRLVCTATILASVPTTVILMFMMNSGCIQHDMGMAPNKSPKSDNGYKKTDRWAAEYRMGWVNTCLFGGLLYLALDPPNEAKLE